MDNLKQAAPHLIMSLIVVVAVVILALDHILTGGEAYGAIIAVGGFTVAGTVSSGSASSAAAAVTSALVSTPSQATATPQTAPDPQPLKTSPASLTTASADPTP